MAIDSGLRWLPFDHWSKPKDRPILARLSDGREIVVRWNPITQRWVDEQGELVTPVEWKDD